MLSTHILSNVRVRRHRIGHVVYALLAHCNSNIDKQKSPINPTTITIQLQQFSLQLLLFTIKFLEKINCTGARAYKGIRSTIRLGCFIDSELLTAIFLWLTGLFY